MAKLALLIGVSKYEPGLNPLPAVQKDVEAMSRVLQNPSMGGFDRVETLINSDPLEVGEAIEIFFASRKKDDLVLLYFSGHGLKDSHGKLYFATRKTRKHDDGQLIKSTAVAASFILDVMNDSRAKRQVVILDCCFSGAFAQGLVAKADDSLDIRRQLGEEGWVILTSSTSTQYSFEHQESGEQQELGLSIYTRYLVEGIETGAADLDSDGWIAVGELHDYAKRRVLGANPVVIPEIYPVKEGARILIAKAISVEPRLKYRRQVERLASSGRISPIARKTLDILRKKIRLSPEETTEIENEVIAPYREYQENLQEYEKLFFQTIQEQYPLSKGYEHDLQELRDVLGLRDEDVVLIQQDCITRLEVLLKEEVQPINSLVSIQSILHLSDLHITTPDQANLWSSQLAEDLRNDRNIPHLDALILSGDIANYSTEEEYIAAAQFLHNLRQDFPLNPEQIILVPGNHDLNWKLAKQAYKLIDRDDYDGQLKDGDYIEESASVIRVRDEAQYKQRFAHFSSFYETIKQKPYPLDYDQQATLDHLPEQNLLILGLNSAWQLDHHYKSRASINTNALSNALTQIRRNPDYKNCLKIAVWHHPLDSAYSDRITYQGFLEQLAVNGFRFFLHGHIYKAETSLYRYDMSTNGRKLDGICAGTFGAPVREWVPGYPLQYNLLKIADNQLTVYTRRREELNGAWKPDARWLQGAGKTPLDYYEISLS